MLKKGTTMIKSPEAKERKRIRDRERRKRLNADPVWRAKENARIKKCFERWKANHPLKYKAAQKKWRDAHKSESRALQYFWRLERDELYRTNPEAYAKHRARRREYAQSKRGDKYKPQLGTRIPDWACKGQDLVDYRSQFLRENITAEQLAFVKELYRERYAK